MDSPLFRLDGCVALVTGAAGYLGSAMAAGLLEAGARVALNGRDATRLDTLRQSLPSGEKAACVVAGDVTTEEGAADVVQRARSWGGRLDILVHSAYEGKKLSFDDTSIADFESATRQSAGSLFALTKAALGDLKISGAARAGGASVIAISSMYGMVSPDPRVYSTTEEINPLSYGAAKAGLIQATRWLACNLAPHRIRVNCVTPGPFPWESVSATNPQFVQRLCQKVPLGRMGIPRDLAGPAVFLASDAAAYVTGANLPVDGGWTAW